MNTIAVADQRDLRAVRSDHQRIPGNEERRFTAEVMKSTRVYMPGISRPVAFATWISVRSVREPGSSALAVRVIVPANWRDGRSGS